MKIVGYTAAYNEAEYIEQSIRSTIDYVDRFVVIEGAFEETVLAGGSPRSNDGTIVILNKLLDEFPQKLDIILAPALPQLQHRDLAFDIIARHYIKDNYWLWLIDADEVYAPQDATRLIEILKSTTANVIKVNSLTFINDFKHYVNIAFPRVFRIPFGYTYKFAGPNHVCVWQNNKQFIIGPEESHEKSIEFYHYSYCKSPESFVLKKKAREMGGASFKWSLVDGKVWTSGVDALIFEGQHPEIMRHHPKNVAEQI